MSWNEPLLATCVLDQDRITEENHDPPENKNQIIIDSTTVTLRNKQLHRRHLSMGNASYSLDEPNRRSRRSSNLSWSRDESTAAAVRPYSWGPIGTMYYLDSLSMECNNPSNHAECNQVSKLYILCTRVYNKVSKLDTFFNPFARYLSVISLGPVQNTASHFELFLFSYSASLNSL